MDLVIIYTALVLFGACLGSFAGAQVWRLRAHELKDLKDAKEKYDHNEYNRLKKLLGKKVAKDRSRCLECGYELKWYDLLPIVSWLSLGGKCRKCKHPIGKFELVMELSVAAFFVVSFVLWPAPLTNGLEIAHFVLWLIAGVIMSVLFAYDTKWFLLPFNYSVALAVVGLGIVGTVAAGSSDVAGVVLGAIGAVASIGGLYAALYVLSKGRWVGLGDAIIGVGLGLVVVEWQLGLLTVFLANFIGCLLVIPPLLMKKLKTNSHVPFGPMLISGAILAVFFGQTILHWYLGLAGF